MVEIHNLYGWIFAQTSLLAFAVAWVSWRQRAAFRATTMVALMFGVSVWSATEAMLWWVPTLPEQRFWLKLTYPGAALVLAAFALFALEIAQIESWLTPRGVFYVSVPPALLCVMAMANPGGLVEASYVAEKIGPYTHFAMRPGPLYWVWVAGLYAIFAASFLLILRTYLRSSGSKRTQTKWVLVGSLVPFVVSIANQFRSSPFEGLESASFFVTGLIFFVAIARGVLLDPTKGRLVTVQDVAEANHSRAMLDEANDFLATELEAAHIATQTLYDQATRDPLTGLYNRRAMTDYFAREMSRSSRTGEPLAVLMLDVDQLKQINDSLSHAAGDDALIAIGRGLLLGARPMDTVCRLGGDEFLVIMSGADEETALARAEELRERIDGLVVGAGDRMMPISVSIGVAAAPIHGRGGVEIMAAADDALHKAKAAGRDRTEVGSV